MDKFPWYICWFAPRKIVMVWDRFDDNRVTRAIRFNGKWYVDNCGSLGLLLDGGGISGCKSFTKWEAL